MEHLESRLGNSRYGPDSIDSRKIPEIWKRLTSLSKMYCKLQIYMLSGNTADKINAQSIWQRKQNFQKQNQR